MMIARFALLGKRMAGIARKEFLVGRVISNSMALRDCRGEGKLVFWFSIAKVPHEDVALDFDPIPFNNQDQLQPENTQQIDLLTLSKSLHYPYIDFPSNLIQVYHKNPSVDQSIKDIIAFRCLKNISQPQLSLAVQILDPFMANFKKASPNQYDTGRQIFTAYFQKHRQRLERGYKEGTCEDKIKYLIVLNNYKLNNSTVERVKEINEGELLAWDRTGLGVTYYSHLLIKSNLSYQHLFKVIQKRLSDESEGTARDRIRIAEILLSIPSFEHCYPKQIIDASLAVLSQNIELVSNLQMLQVLRFIYELKSKESIRLAQKMMKYLTETDFRTQPNRIRMFVPLVLKLLKYAQVTEIETQPMLLELLGKQEIFAPFFNQFSKMYFHTLLFLWSKTSESSATKQKMKEHIIDCLNTYKTAQVSRKDQLIKLFALLSDHEDILNADEKLQAKSDLLTIMSRSQDLQVHYKCLHFLIRDKDSFFKNQQNQQIVNKHLQHFFESTCERNNLDKLQIKSHLHQNIHLAYLLSINQFTSVKTRPHIEGYDFSKEQMIGQQTFQRLIAYLDIAPKSDHLHEVFTNLEPFALYHLGRRKLSYRTIITLLQLGAKISYDRKHLYQQIEKAFFQILVKYDSFTIKMQDLHLIKNNMVKRNLGSPIFRELILRSIEKPAKWKAHRKRYIEDQKKYWSELSKDKGEQQTD